MAIKKQAGPARPRAAGRKATGDARDVRRKDNQGKAINMATVRDRPYINGNFQVDLGTGDVDSLRAGFAEVILPDAAIEAIEYRSGNERTREPRKLMGSVHYDDLILRRGLIGELDLYAWWDQARNGEQNARRNVLVRLLSEDRAQVVFSWRFSNAWPVRYGFSPLSADGKEVVVEELTLTFERMEIE
jgi:phage tail-like protein